MKVLIYNDYELAPTGGPSGYLYNLKSELSKDKIKDINIKFYKEIKQNQEKKIEEKKNSKFSIFRKKIRQRINEIKIVKIKKLIKNINKTKRNEQIDSILSNDIIHFHTTLEFYQMREVLKDYKGIKVLTSHSPQPSYEERLDELKLKKEELKEEDLRKIKEFDLYSFENADYLIFPCEEALEPYLTRDNDIKKIIENKIKNGKVKYLLTGIPSKNIDIEKKYFKQKLGIPEDAIVISYVGRHNEIKGYDIAIKFAKKVLEKYEKVYFVIAGSMNNNIKPLNNERWIEVGWTTEGNKIMKNSDIYLLPNRETYFDLVFLEALSMGCTIMCSETGGNKYFKKYNSNGIIFFENNNIDMMENLFEKLRENIKDKKEENEKENIAIFEENFTSILFKENYIKLMKEIFKKEN